jgi:hypothetical protein
MEGISSTFGGSGGEEKKEKDDKPRFSVVAENLLPKIRRGLLREEEKDDAVVVGWRADVRSRKEREEVLRYVTVMSVGLDCRHGPNLISICCFSSQ